MFILKIGKTANGEKIYQFTDQNGNVIKVIQKDTNRYEPPNHHANDPHFNSLGQQIDEKTGQYLASKFGDYGNYNRSYLRQGTIEKIFENYEKLPNGDYKVKGKNIIIDGKIDIGHAYGWEHRRLSLAAKELKLTQKEFNDYVNARPEKFRLENMSSNRSHRYEKPGNGGIDDIIRDIDRVLELGKFKKGK